MAVAAHVPVTQAEIRDFLKIPTGKTSMNDRLDKIADGVARAINDELGVTMINTAYTEIYDGYDDFGQSRGNTLFVDHYPIVTITTFTDDDVAVGATKYYTYNSEGKIVLKDGTFTADYQSIDIVYTAGHGAAAANVPDTLKLACYKWIKIIYDGDVADFSQMLGEGSTAVMARERIPKDVANLLEHYKCREI